MEEGEITRGPPPLPLLHPRPAARGGKLAAVEALLRHKRLIPILDHVSELPEVARQRLVRNLPAGLVIATSRSLDDGYRERPLSRIEPLQIATVRLQSFFLDYLRQKGQGEVLKDDDLVPAQNQLRRIVGDKPITALLARGKSAQVLGASSSSEPIRMG